MALLQLLPSNPVSVQEREPEGRPAASLAGNHLNGRKSAAAAATERTGAARKQQQHKPVTRGKTEPDPGLHRRQEDPTIRPPVWS